MELYHDTAQDSQGNIINGASVTVTIHSSGLPATIYDKNGGALSNPFLSGHDRSAGEIDFAAADGLYDIQIVSGSTTTLKSISLVDGDTSINTTLLASTANGEGASLVGIEDAGANFTGADVEAALTELADGKQPLDAALTALAGTLTTANKIPYATGTDVAGELDFKDEDNMASNSATAVPSQQSVKAYVDTSTGNIPPTTAGTSTAYTVTYGISAYETGRTYTINFNQSCGDNPTINFDSIGAKSIYYKNGFPVTSGALLGPHQLYYDGTNMVVLDALHVTIDNSSATADYTLAIGEKAKVSFSSATSKALYIGMVAGGHYRLRLAIQNGTSSDLCQLNPNNTTYTGAIDSQTVYGQGSTPNAINTTRDYFNLLNRGRSLSITDIINENPTAGYKYLLNTQYGNAGPDALVLVGGNAWTDTNDWTTLGTLVFSVAKTGTIIIERIH